MIKRITDNYRLGTLSGRDISAGMARLFAGSYSGGLRMVFSDGGE